MVNNIEVYISGSGNADLSNVKAKKANTEITGSGEIDIYATMFLYARITGSGDIHYRGTPNIDPKVLGSGRIKAR